MAKSALVVGVGSLEGVGGALCRRFAREGLHVFAAGRTPEKVEALAKELSREGTVSAIAMDSTVEDDVIRAFDSVTEHAGVPELVVYNAGNNRFKPLLDMDAEFWEETWKVCSLGGFLVGRECGRRMIPEGGGTLIFTGATASIRARPPFTAFASAKAAERALAHGMAREFGAQGLHVGHVIIDGVIDGDQVNERMPQIKESKGADGMLSTDAIADAYWMLHQQDRRAWTLELDLRPHLEQF